MSPRTVDLMSCTRTNVGSPCDRTLHVRCMLSNRFCELVSDQCAAHRHPGTMYTYMHHTYMSHTHMKQKRCAGWSTCASRTTGAVAISAAAGQLAGRLLPPLASRLPQRRQLWRVPRHSRREPSDRRAGAPLDPSVVAAGVRGIIALQAAPAPPRQLVRLRTQAGRQDSQQAGQVVVGEAQQSHNQRCR